MIVAIIIFFLFNYYVFSYESKILINFKKGRLVNLILAGINTFLMVYAYEIHSPYYVSYFCVLITLTIEFLLFSESKFSQAFLCAGILIINISVCQLTFIPIYSYILGVTPYELFHDKDLFFSSLSILFIILYLVFKLSLKLISTNDLTKLSTNTTYSTMISAIILFILTYTIIDVIVLHQKNYAQNYIIMFILTPILSATLFYVLFFYSIKSVKIVAFKRKSDELEASKQKKLLDRKNMEDKVLKDDLTSCYNRKYVMYDLKDKYENNIFNFAILFIDIDGLKSVNDSLGHDIGDEYIVNISNVLKESIRENDLLARLGGDEFLIILNDLEEENIKEILNRIYEKIKFVDKITNNYKVSASIGYIFVNEELLKTGVDNIIKIADDKMRIEKLNSKGE